MPARLRARHQDEIRLKIKAAVIVERMQRFHDSGVIYDGKKFRRATLDEVPMIALRMRAGEMLLRKILPDLQTVEHSGVGGGPIETKDVSMVDVAKRLAFILTSGAAQAQGAS